MTILKSSKRNLSYEEAVTALNSLQTNAITLKKTRRERQANVHLNLPMTRKYLERSGLTMDDLDQLKVIHVSGTKASLKYISPHSKLMMRISMLMTIEVYCNHSMSLI